MFSFCWFLEGVLYSSGCLNSQQAFVKQDWVIDCQNEKKNRQHREKSKAMGRFGDIAANTVKLVTVFKTLNIVCDIWILET